MYTLVRSNDSTFRSSMATGYVGMALLAATLLLGPLNVLRRRANPVSTDFRRDLGIWAGVFSIVHFFVGWQVHMKHRYQYWFRDVVSVGALVPRTDLFGLANYTGLAAVLLAILLLALSNDRSLRRLGTARWKGFQRWNYALVIFVVVHGVAYQVLEKRKTLFVVMFAVMVAAPGAYQFAGYRARRRGDTRR